MYNAIKEHNAANEIPRLTRHTATLIPFYFEPTGTSHSHLHKPNEKKMGVATSLGASSLSATAGSESLRRGARSSCLYVHASMARVARGWDPRLPNMRLLRDPVHHASLKHPTKLRHSWRARREPHSPTTPSKLSQASHLIRTKPPS